MTLTAPPFPTRPRCMEPGFGWALACDQAARLLKGAALAAAEGKQAK
ncbi:hypothetical protein OHC50_12755 [Paenarthrobacter ilicis]